MQFTLYMVVYIKGQSAFITLIVIRDKIPMKIILTGIVFLLTVSGVQAQEEPPYGMGELEAYAVFTDAYRAQDYELAINYGEWIIETKPRTISGYDGFKLDLQFERMVNVYVSAAEEESDPSKSAEYLRKAENVIKEAFETFSEDEIDLYEWHLRRGRFYQEHYDNLDGASIEDAIESYRQLFEMDPQRFAEEGEGYYAGALLSYYQSEDLVEEAQAFIDEIEQYASGDLQATIDEVRESLFRNPEERIQFLESRVASAEGEEREEMLESLADLYEQTQQHAKAKEIALELYEMNNDYENTRRVASIYMSDGDYQNSVTYLAEALEKATDPEEEYQILLELGEANRHLRELEQARNYVRQAINLDDTKGRAYMRMASIYAAAVSQCTGGQALDRNDRTVYWLVLDYLERAREVEPSLASTANSQISSYEGAMPTAEDKFFSDWEAGQSFTIDSSIGDCYGWINETTTVR